MSPPFPIYPAGALEHLPPAWLARPRRPGRRVLDGIDRHRTPLSVLGPEHSRRRDPGPCPGPTADDRRLPRPSGLARPRGGASRCRRRPAGRRGGGRPPWRSSAGVPGLARMLGLRPHLRWRAAASPGRCRRVAGWGAGGDFPLARACRAARLAEPVRPPRLGPGGRQIWRERRTFMAGGRPKPQELTATILFSDIEGFPTIAEAARAGPTDELARDLHGADGGVVTEHAASCCSSSVTGCWPLMASLGPHQRQEIAADAVAAVALRPRHGGRGGAAQGGVRRPRPAVRPCPDRHPDRADVGRQPGRAPSGSNTRWSATR